MNEINQGTFIIHKNKWGYTIFSPEGIILSDAPYKRLKTDPHYKKKFVETLKSIKGDRSGEDKKTLQEWIDDIEELEE